MRVAPIEVIRVPKTNGNAPNVFLTGSHVLFTTNFGPKLTIAGHDSSISKKKIVIKSTMMDIAER